MVKKDTIDTVLKKFLTSRRMPPYKELTLEERKAEYAIMQTGYGFAVACFALEGEDCAWHEKAGSIRL